MRILPELVPEAGNQLVRELLDPASLLTQKLSAMDDGNIPQTKEGAVLSGLAHLLRDSTDGIADQRGGTPLAQVIGSMRGEVLSRGTGEGLFIDDQTPGYYVPGLNPGGVLQLLEAIQAGKGDQAVGRLLRNGSDHLNPRTSSVLESRARVALPGLNAEFRLRSTDPTALGRDLLPRDVTQLLKLQAGMDAANNQMQLDVAEAIEAVRRDQDAKIARAEGLLAQARSIIPGLIQNFREALGTRTQKVSTTTDDRRTVKHIRNLRDGTLTDTHTITTMKLDEADVTAPAVPGELTLPSLKIQTGRSEVTQFSGAGFAMRDGEEAHVGVHRSPDAIEVLAHGDTAFAAAQVTQVVSEGMTIAFHGGSMKIGG